jgi:xanthine/uracil/vitamin C permease (AzgA family)
VRRVNSAAIIGIFLVLLGVLLLLESLGALPGGWEVALAAVFLLGGLGFLWAFATDREWWWASIPGMALVGIGLLIGYGALAPEEPGGVAAGLFLGSLGVGFLLVYLRNRQAWWAIIPCGVMITLALVTGLESESELGVGGVFFLGLALTFLVVYLVPNPEGRMTWALIPAAVLGIMGFLILAAAVQLIGFLWPLALVVVGAYLLFRALRQSPRSL